MVYIRVKSGETFNVKKKTIWITLIILGLIVKIILMPVKTGDYIGFLEPWINFIKANGYASSLKYSFYDYTPSYIYILIAIAKTGLNPLIWVKVVSILFEYLAAFFIGKIAFLKYKSNLVIWISLAVVPLLPSVMLNSSYLSQCDSIYSAFVLGSVYFLLIKKQLLAIVFLGIAFALKTQTAIMLPFFFVMMLRGNIRWYYFSFIPLIYIISILPAWLYGRDFIELLSIYISQSSHYKFLTMNFPNLYIWFSNDNYELIKIIGIIFTALLTLTSGFWLSQKKFSFSLEIRVKIIFLSAIIIPFFLPGMHERYMYLGDVTGVLYFLIVRKNIHLPVGILLVSFYSYIRCSRYNDILPMEPAFFVYLLVIILTTSDLVKSLKNTRDESAA